MISLKNFSLNSILLLPQRFAGPNKQVHLIGLGEVVPRLGEGWRAFTGPSKLLRLSCIVASILPCAPDKTGTPRPSKVGTRVSSTPIWEQALG